jgi:hypothetical protein
MSRSRKRNPGWTDGEGGYRKRYSKRAATRKVRHADEVGTGGSYKKHFEQWNIADYKYRLGWSDGIKKEITTVDQYDIDEDKRDFTINYKFVRK